ncbi:MAG: 3D domain-containing protein [Sporomusaceae bacterium]|nr:3D domain-containing protein [Sporomusaceae bacterium]
MRKKLLVCLLAFVFSSGGMLAAAAQQAAGTVRSGQAASLAEEYPLGPPPSADPVLTQGAKGEQVVKIQQLLAESGFYAGAIDGSFGPATRAAIERFQARYSLPVTGMADRSMIDALQRAKGTPDRYRRVIHMEASAYTSEDPGNGSYTYRGNRLRKGLVAVDPRVIPLGARLYIEGYGYAVADDTGGYIKGHRIDLAYENRQEALRFGRRTVPVYILD